jgi:hypothetical protein
MAQSAVAGTGTGTELFWCHCAYFLLSAAKDGRQRDKEIEMENTKIALTILCSEAG